MIFKASSQLVDSIVNHPTVRGTAQRGTYRLTSAVLLESGAVAYADYHGALALFVPMEAALVYQGHVFAVEGSRGAAALLLGRQALHRLFTDHRAIKLVAAVPLQLPAARYYCRRLGLKLVGRDLLEEQFELEAVQWADL